MISERRCVANRASAMQNVIKAALLFLIIALAAPVAAQDFDAGLEAIERGDYAAALREFRKAAEQGHAPAQINLADMHFGVHKHSEAANWYRKAADQGDARAELSLGTMYTNGTGVPQDSGNVVPLREPAQ